MGLEETMTFDTVEQLEKHVAEKQSVLVKLSVMDNVEHTFITIWNYHRQFTMPACQPHIQQFLKNWTVLYMKLSIIKVGFCLAGQPSIITKSKKKLLWQSFMDGKQSRKMKTPDKVKLPKDCVRLPSFQNSCLYE